MWKAHAYTLEALIRQGGDVHVSPRDKANDGVTVGPDAPASSLNILDDDVSEEEADLVPYPGTDYGIQGPLIQ